MLFSAVQVKTQIQTYSSICEFIKSGGVFLYLLSTELSETKFPCHWYHLVLQKLVTLFSCLTELSSIHVFSQVTLPVYLNFTRADLIFTVDFEIATKEDPRSFYERGVAVLCTE